MSSLEDWPSFELTEVDGELFVHATWVTYTPGALVGMDWQASAEPQRHALDACLIAVRQHRRVHPGDSVDFLQQEIEVAVRRLEAGEQCVHLCDGVHQVSRANFYIDLTLDELVRVRNPLRLFWPYWRGGSSAGSWPDWGPSDAGPPDAGAPDAGAPDAGAPDGREGPGEPDGPGTG